MSPGQDEDRRLDWLEALHEAVVAGQDEAFSQSDSRASQAVGFDKLRDCLRRLEDARRDRNWNLGSSVANLVAESSIPQRIGKFEILRSLGGGGQGVVFLAFDTELRRQVALKLPKPGALASPDARRRFLREAHAAAGLNHPGIVAVHEIVDALPTCYLVSDYCPGGSLQQYLQEHPGAISPRAAAQIVSELAASVHYAHQHGVLHRDVKPSNVFLVDRHQGPEARPGEDAILNYTPKLGDFGLARLAESDADHTASGTILGTPAYMAPEQAGGRIKEVCPATDVYGLGTVLFELLAGRPTFRGTSEADTLRQVLFVEPDPLRVVNPQVPRDLEAVCNRALEKDPRRRYSSAAALADDLQRYLQGLPTRVRPLTPLGKLWRAACRRPAIATLVGLLSAAVIVAAALFISSDIEQRRLNARLVELARDATDLAYAAEMQLADQAWKKHDISGLETILDRFDPKPGEYDPRGVEWHYLHTRLHDSSQTIIEQNGPEGCVQFSSNGSLLAVGGREGIQIWKMPAVSPAMKFREVSSANINALAFSADGQLLAAASNSGAVLVCDLTTGKLLKKLQGAHSEWVADVDFSPDGERLCSVDGSGMIVLWDWKTGKPLQTFRGHDQALRSVHFSRDGQHVIVGRQEGNLQIWNLANQTVTASVTEAQLKPRGRAVWPRDIELSADRSRMAVCWDIGGVKLYDIADTSQPKLLESLPQETGNQLALLGNDQLVVGSAYGLGKIWRLGRQEVVRELRGHRDKIVSLAVSPDERQIATASRDGTVRVWPAEDQLTNGKELATLGGRCVKLIVSPKGDELALEQGEPRQVAILKIATGELQTDFPDLPGEPINVEFLAGGDGLAISTDSTVSVYDRTKPHAVWQWTRPTSAPSENRLQELWGTKKLLLVKAVHDIWALDLESHTVAWQRTNPEAFWDFAISPDERTLYASDQVGKIHEIRLADGKTLRVFETSPNPVKELAISTDGHYLLSGSENRELRLFDRVRGIKALNLAPIDGVVGFARFTADGATLIARHNYGYLSFWDVSSGQRLMSIGPWGVHQLSWDLSPDGRTAYLAVNEDGRTFIRSLTLCDADDRSP